jgi:hypothetical protein
MKTKKNYVKRFLSTLLLLCIFFIPWFIGYLQHKSILDGFIHIGYFMLGALFGAGIFTFILWLFKKI